MGPGWLLAGCAGTGADPQGSPASNPLDETGTIGPADGDPCNGIDDDRDGMLDEDPDFVWYADGDGDGLGTDTWSERACSQPPGFVPTPGDCDDSDAELASEVGPIRWVEVSTAAGLTQSGPSWNGEARCAYDLQAGGAAVGDVDLDGDLDVFLPRMYLQDTLLLNDGAGVFTPAPDFVGSWGGSNGAMFVDVDGDRDLDLWVTAMGADPDLLYVNDGSGRFVEEGALRGAALDPGPLCAVRFGASAADVDLDGDLDVLVAGWQEEVLLGLAERTRLLVNDGTGHFSDGTVAAGLDALWQRAAFGALFADRDGDLDPDLHLVADWNGTGLFLNEAGVFVEADDAVFTDENGMGGDLADADGDGDLDWFVTSIWDPAAGYGGTGWGKTGNRLYVDPGDGTFVDGTDAAGVREGQWGWGTAFFDQDLDGDLDLALTGGFPGFGFVYETGRFYRNQGDGTFEDHTCESGWVQRGQGRSIVPFDADRDGDQDLLVVANGEPPRLWRAEGAEGTGWLAIELEQSGPNPYGIGAEVTVVAGGRTQVRLLSANPLFLAGRPPEVHFGLGADEVDEVRVRWPDGVETVFPPQPSGFVRLFRGRP